MKKLQLPFYLLSILYMGIGCMGCPCKPNYVVESSTLQNLHNLMQGNPIDADKSANDMEVYIDYSDGMHPAIESCNRVFDEVLNIVKSDKTRYLVCGPPDSLQTLTIAELGGLFDPKNANSFSVQISILDKPLERIVNTDKQAIYITDFELIKDGIPRMQNVDGGTVLSNIDLSPSWATIPFDKWLAAGHSIDVFAKPFAKKRAKGVQNQYLYFIVFTPRTASENRVVEGLTKLQESETDLKHFSFSKSRFQAITDYKNPAEKGLSNYIGLLEHFEGQGYEYYKMKFQDFSRLEKEGNKNILDKLSINQQLEGFSNLGFHVQVEDVTAAYHLLADSMQCGSGTNLDKLKLTGKIVTDYFELETKSLGNKIDFGIKKHDNFTAINQEVKSQLFKVTILFNTAKYQPDTTKMEQVLQWKDVNIGYPVPGLYGGLKEAASRMDLKETPVYTYYIDVE